MADKPISQKPANPSDERRARLAAALRENLVRRKQQERRREHRQNQDDPDLGALSPQSESKAPKR